MFVAKNSRKHYKFLPPRRELDLPVVIKGGGHRGTTDKFATIPFHLVLFSAALVKFTNSSPVHSLILSFHLFLCLPLLYPFTAPVGLSLLNQKTLRCDQTTLVSASPLPGSKVRHILQWLLGSFSKPPHW